MPSQFSVLDSDAMAQARALLEPPRRPERVWPVLGAAGLLAISALIFAAAMVTAPPPSREPVAAEQAAN